MNLIITTEIGLLIGIAILITIVILFYFILEELGELKELFTYENKKGFLVVFILVWILLFFLIFRPGSIEQKVTNEYNNVFISDDKEIVYDQGVLSIGVKDVVLCNNKYCNNTVIKYTEDDIYNVFGTEIRFVGFDHYIVYLDELSYKKYYSEAYK